MSLINSINSCARLPAQGFGEAATPDMQQFLNKMNQSGTDEAKEFISMYKSAVNQEKAHAGSGKALIENYEDDLYSAMQSVYGSNAPFQSEDQFVSDLESACKQGLLPQ